jgi:UDP-N-acetylglucosamine 3-dehydrogenase
LHPGAERGILLRVTPGDSIGVGLVGCGRLAQTAHLGILTRLPGARLTAIAEPDAGRREAAVQRVPGVRATAALDHLLALDDVDAVVLALPPAEHAGAAFAAFEAGKHVYLEKPLATDRQGGEGVVAAWRESGRIGMIGFNYRFNRLYRQARDVLRGGELGKPVAVLSTFTTASGGKAEWQRSRASGGGALLDLGSHHIDLVRWLLGQEVETVDAEIRSDAAEGDTATVGLRMSDETLVQSFFSHRTTDDDRLEIHCERGRIRVDRGRGFTAEVRAGRAGTRRSDQLRHLLRSARGLRYGFEKHRAAGHEPSWRCALEQFVAAAHGRAPTSPDLQDGWSSLEVVLAAEESAGTGRRVRLGDVRTAKRPSST